VDDLVEQNTGWGIVKACNFKGSVYKVDLPAAPDTLVIQTDRVTLLRLGREISIEGRSHWSVGTYFNFFCVN